MEQLEKKLQVQNLRISFKTAAGKVQAVRGITFDLYKGETLAIVGESGSGKSVTSKAILGIQAANALTEGGEILYDGMDLLQIDEQDFCRLRGDRLAMIFQDPLSSLNPIMRVGKQLTEAMLLKSRMRKNNSRTAFRERTHLLEQTMQTRFPERRDLARQIEQYRKMETALGAAEKASTDARQALARILPLLERLCFLKEKNADTAGMPEKILDYAGHARHEDALSEADLQDLRSALDGAGKTPDIRPLLERMQAILDRKPTRETLLKRSCPSFTESDEAAFRADAQAGIEAAMERFAKARKEAVAVLESGLEALKSGGIEAVRPHVASMSGAVARCIDPIDPVRDSRACTFAGSLKKFLRTYEDGVRHNAGRQVRYEREMKKAERRQARGKTWTVPAPSIIDLEQVRANMTGLIEAMIQHLNTPQKMTGAEKTEAVLSAIHESALGMVANMTPWEARERALRLMEEVGISEPEKRYKQYPFEFSGGMRQRIVIAIALAADPDVLICDEPTTALDVTIQAQILELINRLKEERHLSIIFITHDLGVVANMADRIAVMYAGQIVEYGTSEEIFYSPAHPYTWALLSSMPDLDTKERLEAIPGTPPNMIYPPKGDAFAERNRYAMQIDFEQQPPRFQITPTHWAATWLLHEDAPKVEMPESVRHRIEKMKARMEMPSRAATDCQIQTSDKSSSGKCSTVRPAKEGQA